MLRVATLKIMNSQARAAVSVANVILVMCLRLASGDGPRRINGTQMLALHDRHATFTESGANCARLAANAATTAACATL